MAVTRLTAPPRSLSFVDQTALSETLAVERTEVVLILGDRYELLDVVLVATVQGCAIAHCCGGERTAGAFDNQVRDAVTKMAHLHYPAHQLAADRLGVLQEEQWRICVSGEPGLDSLLTERRLDSNELRGLLGVEPGPHDIMVAVHPVTHHPQETRALLECVRTVASHWEGRVFLSSPNGDPGSEAIVDAWRDLAGRDGRRIFLPSLGSLAFRSLVARCGALVGNSSAGLVEAPSLGTPSVDVGARQEGRLRGSSVISCPEVTPEAVGAAVEAALRMKQAPTWSAGPNPYGDGRSAPRILDHLVAHARRPDLRAK